MTGAPANCAACWIDDPVSCADCWIDAPVNCADRWIGSSTASRRAAGEDEEGATILHGILRDPEQFELVVSIFRRLIDMGQLRDARELIGACIKLFAACAPPLPPFSRDLRAAQYEAIRGPIKQMAELTGDRIERQTKWTLGTALPLLFPALRFEP